MNRNYCFILTNGTQLDFKQVFDQYFNSLVLLLIVIWESEKRVNLFVQDAFLALWENRLEFPDELSVKAYLYSTVRNKALNVLKHRKIEQHYMNEILRDEDAELYYMRSVMKKKHAD
ncbi:MAG: sigma factor [Butyricimonas faecihominis]